VHVRFAKHSWRAPSHAYEGGVATPNGLLPVRWPPAEEVTSTDRWPPAEEVTSTDRCAHSPAPSRVPSRGVLDGAYSCSRRCLRAVAQAAGTISQRSRRCWPKTPRGVAPRCHAFAAAGTGEPAMTLIFEHGSRMDGAGLRSRYA